MRIFSISPVSEDETQIKNLMKADQFLFLKNGFLKSEEEALLAEFLAKKSFKEKTNLAKKFKYEFLLYLTGKTDISSATKVACPSESDKNRILLVFVGSSFDSQQVLSKLPLKAAILPKNAQSLDLERISLSRIKN